jgi:hypothetical protein
MSLGARSYFLSFFGWDQGNPRDWMQGLVRQRTSRIAAEESKPHLA